MIAVAIGGAAIIAAALAMVVKLSVKPTRQPVLSFLRTVECVVMSKGYGTERSSLWARIPDVYHVRATELRTGRELVFYLQDVALFRRIPVGVPIQLSVGNHPSYSSTWIADVHENRIKEF